jgi:S1-C subfamily serine protease
MLPNQSTTEFVPFSKRQYDNQITYWRKRRPNKLGLFCDYVPEALRLQLQRNVGAYVIGMEDGGAAFVANVLAGDVVVSLGSRPIHTPADLELALEATEKSPVEIEVIRAGRSLKLLAAIGPR